MKRTPSRKLIDLFVSTHEMGDDAARRARLTVSFSLFASFCLFSYALLNWRIDGWNTPFVFNSLSAGACLFVP